MTHRELGDDGTIDDLPWASVFDPAANARALSAIQAEGFRAASRLVDRFVRAVGPAGNNGDGQPTAMPSGAGNGKPDADGAANPGDAAHPGLPDFERLTRAWWSMAGQFLLRSLPAAADGDAVSLDVNHPDSQSTLTLETDADGAATAEVWLHNRGTEDCPDVRLQCSDLLSHQGDVIPATAVLMDTPVVPMPRRSSRGVTITITVAPQVGPGVYRGTVLATGHPELWLPVVLTVRRPDT